jgi:membrane peptidoglycan carboxypeptidase
MAGAMAGFANNGIYCTPIAIDKAVVRATGEELKVPVSECTRAVSSEVAAAVTYALERVITGGTGTRSRINDGVPIAGKTGTTDETIQSWMTGYSSKVSTATWVGNVVGKQSLNRTSIQGVPGNSVRHDIWRQIMAQANATYGGDSFTPASSLYLGATTVTMPAINALLPDVAETVLKGAGLSVQVADTTVPSPNAPGSIAFANFDEGSTVIRGSLVTLFVSKGGMKAIPNVAGKTVAEARSVLSSAGFLGVAEPQESQPEYFVCSIDVPEDYVVGTFPESGRFVELISGIILRISRCP